MLNSRLLPTWMKRFVSYFAILSYGKTKGKRTCIGFKESLNLEESPAVTKIQQLFFNIQLNLSNGQTVTYICSDNVERIEITGPTQDV